MYNCNLFVFAKVVSRALCVTCLRYFIVVCHISLSSGQSELVHCGEEHRHRRIRHWSRAECLQTDRPELKQSVVAVAARFVATVCTLLCLASLCSLSLCPRQFRLLTL